MSDPESFLSRLRSLDREAKSGAPMSAFKLIDLRDHLPEIIEAFELLEKLQDTLRRVQPARVESDTDLNNDALIRYALREVAALLSKVSGNG